MNGNIFTKIGSFWTVQREFRLKVLFQALTFLLMSACVSIWRPLKISIFAKIVGSDYVPDAKIYSILFLIPLVLVYSKLVDVVRRHQLLYCFNLFHAVGGLIFYFILSHPVYGIANTHTSSTRFTGWFFYFFMESFNAFLSTTFWSFADSINNHQDAKNYYGLFVAGSKIGSIIAAGSLYFSLTLISGISDNILLPNTLLFGSLLLLGAAFSIFMLIKTVPDNYMHGYEAVYQEERTKKYLHAQNNKYSMFKTIKESIKSSIEGLLIILKNPYVLGVFALVLFYEMIIVIFDFRVLKAADVACDTAGSLTAYYALYYLLYNTVGLFVVLFGTTPVLRFFGARFSLFVFPILIIVILFVTFLFPYATVFFWALVALRALNYALNHPTREILYIPTTKNIKFKAKAWTDAFGSRIAKGFGSVFNKTLQHSSTSFAIATSLTFSLGLASAWLVVVYFLGKVLQEALTNKKVIGSEDTKD